jgi:hypothetical protein
MKNGKRRQNLIFRRFITTHVGTEDNLQTDEEVRVIISDLLHQYKTSHPDTSWSDLAKKARLSTRSVERYAARESTPTANNARSLLDSLDLTPARIETILEDYYKTTYTSRDGNDPVAAKELAANTDMLLIWSMASAEEGTNLNSIIDYVPRLTAKKLTETMLNKGILREINGKLMAKDFSLGNPLTQLETSEGMAKIGLHLFGQEITKALNEVWGWSEDGLQTIMRDIDNFSSIILKRMEQKELRGNIPTLIGLTMTAIKGQK